MDDFHNSLTEAVQKKIAFMFPYMNSTEMSQFLVEAGGAGIPDSSYYDSWWNSIASNYGISNHSIVFDLVLQEPFLLTWLNFNPIYWLIDFILL